MQGCSIWVTPTHLFVFLGSLHAHTKRLVALVALWTGQAVETWIGVDAKLCSTHFVANIRHHVTLGEGKMHQPNANKHMHKWGVKTVRLMATRKTVNFTSLISSQWVPFPRNPAVHGPHSQEPSAELLQSTPAKHGLDRQPSERGVRWQEWNKQENWSQQWYISKASLKDSGWVLMILT